ncbi:MAG: HD domain-containing protein [Oscillospiraceae bacterium]|nr:HD domain-containing protein [Oscillospiraceae bacterium]
MQDNREKNSRKPLMAKFPEVETYMKSCLCDVAHDAEHVYRVLNYALQIAENEANAGGEVDFDILTVACLLHDISRPEQFADPSIDHATHGAVKAYDWLILNGYSEEFSNAVKNCIEMHRFRSNNPPESIEAKILFDADKLEVCGAIGIARTLLHNAHVMEPLYTVSEEGLVQNGKKDKQNSFLREYKYKLEKIYDKFYTKHGTKLAKKRKPAAKGFYKAILAEVRECYRQEV